MSAIPNIRSNFLKIKIKKKKIATNQNQFIHKNRSFPDLPEER